MHKFGRWAWYGYLFLWAWSIPLLAFDLVPPGTEWMGTVILVLSGGLAGWWLIERFQRAGLLVASLIFILSWGIEHLGVTTGWPFGRYVYNGVLQPTLFNVVPVAIPCAWLMVIPGAWELARMLLGHLRPVPMILLTASLATLLDIVIEPVAVHINSYWTWFDSGPIAGIPLSNFVAWWSVAAVLATLLSIIIAASRWRARMHSTTWSLPVLLYLATLVLFSIVNLTHGFILTGIIGLIVLASCGYRLQTDLAQLKPAIRLRQQPRP